MTELLDVSTEPTKPAQTNAPGTEPTSWMPLSDEQRNTAPENIKKLLEAKKWTSFDEVVNGYVDLEKILGRGEHIFRPESPDDTEGWAKYWTQLGVPSIDEYEFEADESVPFNDDYLKDLRSLPISNIIPRSRPPEQSSSKERLSRKRWPPKRRPKQQP